MQEECQEPQETTNAQMNGIGQPFVCISNNGTIQ